MEKKRCATVYLTAALLLLFMLFSLYFVGTYSKYIVSKQVGAFDLVIKEGNLIADENCDEEVKISDPQS